MKILIVDDEPLVRRSLSRVFKSRGHEIFEATNGVEGLELWLSARPDLVFLDVLMPGLTGPQVMEKVQEKREMYGTPKVVLMSAYSGEQDLDRVKMLGVEKFVAKPFDDVFALAVEMEKLVT